MLHHFLIVLIFVISCSCASQTPLIPFVSSKSPSHHAHIFNSVSSALRQWGNTLNPNGATLIPGVIRPHTTLYHARTDPGPPPEPEWLAFDAEMSFGIFGNGRGGWGRNTWMRTYSSNRELKVAYFDGMSAMISNSGTFDFQDFMGYGLNGTGTPTGKVPRFLFGEYLRAQALCNWTREADLGVDGFVRMNAGFELIVCDWSAWDLVANVNVTRMHQSAWEPTYEWARSSSWHNFQSEGRVELDWRGFVTAHGRGGVSLDPTSADKTRRMTSMANQTILDIRAESEDVLRNANDSRPGSVINWQMVTDTITQRYGSRILQIHSLYSKNTTNATDIADAAAMVHAILVPFYNASIEGMGIDECINLYTYRIDPSRLTVQEKRIYESIIYVLTRICNTFYDLFQLLPPPNGTSYPLNDGPVVSLPPPVDARTLINTLREELNWPSFITCPVATCPDSTGSFCTLAVWPVIWAPGDVDWPKCIGRADFVPRWGGRGPGGPYRRPGSGQRPPGGGPGGGSGRPGGGPGGGRGRDELTSEAAEDWSEEEELYDEVEMMILARRHP